MQELPKTSESLVQRLRDRNEIAWAEFMEIYGRSVRSFCRRRGLLDADADDVCSQVMIELDRLLAARPIKVNAARLVKSRCPKLGCYKIS